MKIRQIIKARKMSEYGVFRDDMKEEFSDSLRGYISLVWSENLKRMF